MTPGAGYPHNMAKILLVDEPATRVAGPALEAMGHACVLASDAREAEVLMKERPFDVLVLEIRDKTEAFRFLDKARDLRPECRGVAVLAESLEEYFPELLGRDQPRHFLADNGAIDVEDLGVTVRKLSGGDIFGIEQYGVTPAETLKLRSPAEKYPVIERVRDFYLTREVAPRIVRNVELILNELLMNAMFDAPVDANGAHPYNHRDRSDNFELGEAERPTLVYGIGESHLALSVSDPFGTMSQEIFFACIHRCFTERSVLEGAGKGAGMGLFLVFKSLDRMVINVAPRRRTEMIALIDHRASLGELKRRRHSFHYFRSDDQLGGAERRIL